MGYNAIDPDGVIAMSAATLAASESVGQIGAEAQRALDAVSHLVPGAPNARARAAAVAGDLAELAGWARQHAIRYVDDVKPLHDLATAGYWLPDLGKLGWDGSKPAGDNIESTLRSDEFGALPLGLAGALLDRYRRWSLFVPKPGAVLPTATALRLPPVDDVFRGTPYVRAGSGLLVPQGSAGDPAVARLGAMADGPDWYKPTQRSLVPDPELGRPPTWARTGSNALFVVGAGLTLWDSAAGQWEEDSTYHPEWTTGQKVADTAVTTTLEGGGAVAGGYYGAIAGAELGAAIGSIFPGPGTLIGGVVGGLVGGFVGSKAGKAVGTALKEGGEALWDGATSAWHSVFG